MRFNVPIAFIAIFAACFAVVGTLVLPKARADEHDNKAVQTLNPRVRVPVVTAPAANSVYGQDGKAELATANSSGHRRAHTAVPLGSVAMGGLLGLVATFGLRRFSAASSSRRAHCRKGCAAC
jgi:predicted permease